MDENVTDLGLVNIFTVYGNGKININTTSKTILSALPVFWAMYWQYIWRGICKLRTDRCKKDRIID